MLAKIDRKRRECIYRGINRDDSEQHSEKAADFRFQADMLTGGALRIDGRRSGPGSQRETSRNQRSSVENLSGFQVWGAQFRTGGS